MEECVFCKIAMHGIPCYKVYEDEEFLSFLDISPRNEGHTLVIPKRHYRWVWDIEERQISKYFAVCGKIANALRKAFNTSFVVSLIMGEEIPHAHIHLIPRFPGDGHGASVNLGIVRKISNEKMEEIAERIKSYL